ncbi:unnamed protein product [Eruca vesicaria subsp. sativa]|uniref:Myb-like domain-containing protein n=1 Tax=Eruca vesicaria subsp. sativa TaxID=29727 RepID=A0ABC8KYC8_ERUVS|nr:unnamed protein product [Eruca vesicaria subsp. sativa]
MNNENKQEMLPSGAPCFIKPNDLNTENDLSHKITDDSKKIEETTTSSDPCDGGGSSSQATKKFKLKWTQALEDQFEKAIEFIGIHKVTPKQILNFMNLKFLTKAHIASKLQKYRKNLNAKEESMKRERIAMYPEFSSTGGYINPQHSYNYNTRLDNKNPFMVQPGYGLGQSSSMMNNNAGLHVSPNYMNSRPGYNLSQSGCNLFPGRGNLAFQNGMLPLEEKWRSIPGTSQDPSSGQYGTTSIPGTSQDPSSGQYGTTSIPGTSQGPSSGTTDSSNYAGVRRDEYGNLVGPGGIRVNGRDNGSFSGIRVHGAGSGSLQGLSIHGNGHGYLGGIRGHGPGYGSFGGVQVPGNGHGSLGGMKIHGNDNGIRVHDTSNGYSSLSGVQVRGHGSLGGIKINGNDNGLRVYDTSNDYGSFGGVQVHGTGNSNGSLDGIIGHGSSNSSDSLSGIRVHGTDTSYVDGINFDGTSNHNDSLGVNYGTNWNFNNNNVSKHGSSTPMFPSTLPSFLDSKDQSQNNLVAQIGGVIPALDNPNFFNDHQYNINEAFPNTNNSQFHQDQQHQGDLTGVNFEAHTAYPLEDISSWSFSDGTNNEKILNSPTANPEMYCHPTQDMNITNQGNNHEDILNSGDANPEMYYNPTQDMTITNQVNLGNNHEEILNSRDANPEMCFPTLDMTITNQASLDYAVEDMLNSLLDPDSIEKALPVSLT